METLQREPILLPTTGGHPQPHAPPGGTFERSHCGGGTTGFRHYYTPWRGNSSDQDQQSSVGGRRATSVTRPPPHPPSTGEYYRRRPLGCYRSRSGSVPPPSRGIESSTSSGALRRPSPSSGANGRCLSPASDGTAFSSEGPHQRGCVMAHLELLQMECSSGAGQNSIGGGDTSQTPSEIGADDPLGQELCEISLEERLVKTNPIWFLPDLQRSGAVHLLQGKEEGCFLVRGSSRSDTLAISVRLPPDKGPLIQHYLIEILPNNKYSLEASERLFPSLPALICYHSNNSDELPVKLRLPKCVQEARSRHELASIALLGQEFWGTRMASPTAAPQSTIENKSPTPPTPTRPHDISFSSFGKAGVQPPYRGSQTSIVSPQSFVGSHFGGSTTSLTPTRPAPAIPSPIDRSSLNLNLSQIEDFVREATPTFTSFRSQPNTPVTNFKPNPPPRTSPPTTQGKTNRPTPPQRMSPANTASKDFTAIEHSISEVTDSTKQAPQPPQRWVKSSPPLGSTPSPSGSNITVTTTLTFNVNQVRPLNIPLGEELTPTVSGTDVNCSGSDHSEHSFHVQVSSLEISPCGATVSTGEGSALVPVTGGTSREGLRLHIRPAFTSPQSTPCTPATPLDTPLSEEGKPKVRMRRNKKDKRRFSNHYHEANIIDGTPCYRSSLADKISDYEDLWSSPPRDVYSSKQKDSSDAEDSSPPCRPSLTTFKPRSEISKSLGDLSDINQGSRGALFNRRNTEGPFDGDMLHIGERISYESFDSYRKTSSPFYVEPADALKEHERKMNSKKGSSKLSRKIANRFSDSNIQWRSRHRKKMERIDSNENLNCISSSIEDIANEFNLEKENNALNSKYLKGNHRRPSRLNGRAKAIAPPRISQPYKREPPWRLDSSWEYMNYGDLDTDLESPGEGTRFPVENSEETDSIIIPGDLTVQSLINEKLPIQNTVLGRPGNRVCVTRNSEYDNIKNLLEEFSKGNDNNSASPQNDFGDVPPETNFNPKRRLSQSSHYIPSTVSDSGTEFSEPWDSWKWDTLLENGDCRSSRGRRQYSTDDSDLERTGMTDSESLVRITGESAGESNDDSDTSSIEPTISFQHVKPLDTSLRSRILSPQMLALRHRKDAEGGATIRKYALTLGADSTTTFSQAVKHFITCTLESPERDPAVVVRNVRQFMSGMKNYLVTSGEKQFEATVKRERSNLKATEFLNLDAILEDVLVRLVLRPLWSHINKLYVEAYTSNGSIQKLMTNMKYAKSLPCWRLGIRPEIQPPHGASLDNIQHLLSKMQHVFAPREKLAHLLRTVSHVYHSMYGSSNNSNGVPITGDADDLVSMIMWVLSHSMMVSAEVEADYMHGLLPPSSASGEASYYLNAFHSAIHSLKNLSPSPGSSPGNSLDSVKQDIYPMSEQGVMKIVVPDENNGSIVTRTLPIRPGCTSREICKMMAHKLRVTNPQDYGLYKLVDGQESLLGDNECPQRIRCDLGNQGHHCLIAFKRIDAKIAWPMINE